MSSVSSLTAEQQQEFLRCIAPGGFRYFLAKYVKIEDQVRGIIPFEMWPCHVEVVEVLETERLVSILKARQIGLTWLLGAAYPVWLGLFHVGKLSMLFSTREDEAAEMIRRAKFVWSQLPAWMRGPAPKPDNEMELRFGTGSGIIGFPSKPTAGSGYTASYVLADEHAKQPYAAEQYAAVRPVIEHGGQFVSNSTAFGSGTFHHRLWTSARKGLNRFKALFFPYSARPGRDKAWWEQTRESWAMSGEDVRFMQEYPETPEDAVTFSVARFFPVEHLQAPAATIVEPIGPGHLKHAGLARLARLRPTLGTLGVRVYQEPIPGAKYVVGADASEGIGEDKQAAVVLDAETGDEVCIVHGDWPITAYGTILFEVAEAYEALLGIEDNNHGHAVIVTVQAAARQKQRERKVVRSRLYYREPLVAKPGRPGRPGAPGWHTGPRTKALMYDALHGAFVDGTIRVATQAILEEAKSVVSDPKTGKLGAERGYHDDLVVATAIALQMLLQTVGRRRSNERQMIPFGMGQHAEAFAEASAEAMRRQSQSRVRVRKRGQGTIIPIVTEPKRSSLQRIARRTAEKAGAQRW